MGAKSLVVVSAVKAVCKEQGLRTSGESIAVLNKHLTNILKKAAENAKAEKRLTVMDRDFAGVCG